MEIDRNGNNEHTSPSVPFLFPSSRSCVGIKRIRATLQYGGCGNILAYDGAASVIVSMKKKWALIMDSESRAGHDAQTLMVLLENLTVSA